MNILTTRIEKFSRPARPICVPGHVGVRTVRLYSKERPMNVLGCALATVLFSAALIQPAWAGERERERERDGDRHIEGQVTSILFSCNMNFRAKGKSVYIGLGWTDVKGGGEISCYDLLHGTTEIIPIRVKAKGPGAGIGVTGLVLSGAVAGVGIEKSPESLLGHYIAIRGNAAVGVGAGGSVGLRVSKGGVTIPVSVQGQTGLGAGVDLLWLDIEADGDKRIEAALPPSEPRVQEQKSELVPAPQNLPSPAGGTTAIAISQEKTTTEKTNIVYLQEGQPLQILDGKGSVIQTIYLKAGAPPK